MKNSKSNISVIHGLGILIFYLIINLSSLYGIAAYLDIEMSFWNVLLFFLGISVFFAIIPGSVLIFFIGAVYGIGRYFHIGIFFSILSWVILFLLLVVLPYFISNSSSEE